MRMISGLVLAAALLAIAPAARADEASDYQKAAGDEVSALAVCTTAYIKPLIATQRDPSEIVAESFSACGDKVGAITIALEGDPTDLTAEKAQQVTLQLLAGVKAFLVDEINKRR